MSLKNTPEQYGTVAKWIHWLTALLFLVAYISVYYRRHLTEAETDANWNALHIHLSVGVSLGVLVILRIVWRMMNTQPTEEPGTKLEHFFAKVGHGLLYAVMILLPITGYFGTGLPTDFFFLFEIPKFADTWLFDVLVTQGLNMDFATFEKPMDFIHKDILGAWFAWILIAGHVAAALYHHFVKGDRTLRKMTKS